MGLKVKIITNAKAYKGKNSEIYCKDARENPEKIIIVYIEITSGQFIELFSKREGQKKEKCME